MKPKYFAFFDVDGTLLNLKSMFSFQQYYMRQVSLLNIFSSLRYRWFELNMNIHITLGSNRNSINRVYYQSFRGRNPEHVKELGREWYRNAKATIPDLVMDTTFKELKKHQAQGGEIVFVSGSFPEVLQPLAEDMGVKYCLATKLEVNNGLYTGAIIPPQTIGYGKAEVVKIFIEEWNVSPADCYAYGDDCSDIPMLEVVGKPIAVEGDLKLMEYAANKQWQVIAAF